jgi:hypothetical protein
MSKVVRRPLARRVCVNLSFLSFDVLENWMHVWSAIRWGATVSTRGEKSWVELPKPYALIGSHPRCDIQISGNRIPSVAYLVVICADRIEAWPVCAIAFPVWGVIEESTQILVGKSRIQFVSEISPDWPQAKASQPGDALNDAGPVISAAPLPDASLFFDWGRGKREKPLNRRVSILGDDHPSLIRMRRVGLEQCDRGIVCLDRRVWMIELHPERISAEEPLVQRLDALEAPIELGRTKIWAGQPANPRSTADEFSDGGSDGGSDANLLDSGEVFGNEQDEQFETRQETTGIPQRDAAVEVAAAREDGIDVPSKETASKPAGDASADVKQPPVLVEQRESGRAKQRKAAKRMRIKAKRIETKSGYPEAGTPSEPEPSPSTTDAKIKDSNAARHQFDRSDDRVETMVTDFTDRLLTTNSRKESQRRKIQWALRIVLAITAIAVVTAILTMSFFPLLRSIYSP